jgi:Icc-related predicted phosphoesterase
MDRNRTTIRLAAAGDLHCTRNSAGELAPTFAAVNDMADVLLLCGDLTDYGTAEEAAILAKELAVVRVPIIGVLGNHDHESATPDDVVNILCDGGIHMLDGEDYELNGVGFAGVKGFGGGFGRRALEPWGEEAIKRFVQEGVDEAMKLERALARLHTPQRIAVLHYAPISATIEGEPCEIAPFLGSSRLEEPINRFEATAVFHGHAHHGSPEGTTATGIPVYNVAMPLLRRAYPDHPPFRVVEIPVTVPVLAGVHPSET